MLKPLQYFWLLFFFIFFKIIFSLLVLLFLKVFIELLLVFLILPIMLGISDIHLQLKVNVRLFNFGLPRFNEQRELVIQFVN